MSFAGIVVACWLAIAAIAFLAISTLGRLAGRGDVEADLGIVGAAELRMLLGEREEERLRGRRLPIEARFGALGVETRRGAFGAAPGPSAAWMSHTPPSKHSSYTT